MRTSGISALWLLHACVTGSNYNQQLTNTMCERYQECERTFFDLEYDNQNECRNDANVSFSDCPEQHCEFDAKAAGECLRGIKKADCADFISDFPTECDRVWVDCDLIDLAVCLASGGS